MVLLADRDMVYTISAKAKAIIKIKADVNIFLHFSY